MAGAPWAPAYSTAARISASAMPCARYGLRTVMHGMTHAGTSSTGCVDFCARKRS